MSASLLDTKLLDAVIDNDLPAVEALIKQGANPNCYEDNCLIRPLHFASVYNSVDVVFALVCAGANISALTSDGNRPIDIARQLNHTDLIAILQAVSVNLVSFYEEPHST